MNKKNEREKAKQEKRKKERKGEARKEEGREKEKRTKNNLELSTVETMARQTTYPIQTIKATLNDQRATAKKTNTQNETKHERKQKNCVNRSEWGIAFNYALHKQLRIAKIIYTLQALIKYWARSAY